MAANVSDAIVYPNRAAKRTARSIRSLSSAKRSSGRPDGANDSGFKVFAAANEIQDFILDGIKQQTIDGEVAALDIFLSALAETDLVGMAAIAVADVAAEGGDLNRVVGVVS